MPKKKIYDDFDTRRYERIQLDYDFVKECIYKSKNQTELATMLGCGTDKVRQFLRENDLYHLYCDVHHVPYKAKKNKSCIICGETRNVCGLHGKSYCKRHYNQIYRYGKVIDSTIYDRNEIIVDGDIAKIILKDKDQFVKCESIIDAEDVEKIRDYKWYESAGYCVTKGVDRLNGIDISNVIFNDYRSKFDHQNHDRLDNRKANLRSVTSHQNAMNMGKKCTNKSGVTGVQRQNKNSPRWTAVITYDYEPIWLGVDIDFDKVVIKRLQGEAKYFKEYSPNYNLENGHICLRYISQMDQLPHYLEVDLEGNVVMNSIVRDDNLEAARDNQTIA